MQERGYTVGDKDNWGTDLTLNVADNYQLRFIVVGSLKNDRYYVTITAEGQIMKLGDYKINLAEPCSCQNLGDIIESYIINSVGTRHFSP
jgi:hypothetical protein